VTDRMRLLLSTPGCPSRRTARAAFAPSAYDPGFT